MSFAATLLLETIKSSSERCQDAPTPTTVVPTLQDPRRVITTECAFCTMQPPSVRQCTVCEPSAGYSLIITHARFSYTYNHMWWQEIWIYLLLHTHVLPEATITEVDWEMLNKDLYLPLIMNSECWPIELRFPLQLTLSTDHLSSVRRLAYWQHVDWFLWHFGKCVFKVMTCEHQYLHFSVKTDCEGKDKIYLDDLNYPLQFIVDFINLKLI